jgi:hypothetical protein
VRNIPSSKRSGLVCVAPAGCLCSQVITLSQADKKKTHHNSQHIITQKKKNSFPASASYCMGPTQLSMSLSSIPLTASHHKIYSSLACRGIIVQIEKFMVCVGPRKPIPPVPIGQFMVWPCYVTLPMLKFDSTESQSLKQKKFRVCGYKRPRSSIMT